MNAKSASIEKKKHFPNFNCVLKVYELNEKFLVLPTFLLRANKVLKTFDYLLNINNYKHQNVMNTCIKVTGSVYVSVTTLEPIWFSFRMKLLIGPGKVYNHFGEGTNTIIKKWPQEKNYHPNIFFCLFL